VLLRAGLVEAFLPDRVGGATQLVTAPSDDEATLGEYWFLPTQAGWRLLWGHHDR
jgi:hypothetical protein